MSRAWDLIHEYEEKRRMATPVGNPFKAMVSVEVKDQQRGPQWLEPIDYEPEFDGMSLETAKADGWAKEYTPGSVVELTIRIPEQFFTETFMKADWDAALAALEAQKNRPEGEALARDVLFALPEYLIDSWDYTVERELYGPDGQEVPLW